MNQIRIRRLALATLFLVAVSAAPAAALAPLFKHLRGERVERADVIDGGLIEPGLRGIAGGIGGGVGVGGGGELPPRIAERVDRFKMWREVRKNR